MASFVWRATTKTRVTAENSKERYEPLNLLLALDK